MKLSKGWFLDRIRKTVYNMCTAAFITWLMIFAWLIWGGLKVDFSFFSAFLFFTAAVIGLKQYFSDNRKPPTGGSNA